MGRSAFIALAERQGPCAFCGGGDVLARHRLWDALDSYGLSAAKTAEEFNVSAAEVRWVRREFRKARKAHRPLPGRHGWRRK